jgi:hypothetical protein
VQHAVGFVSPSAAEQTEKIVEIVSEHGVLAFGVEPHDRTLMSVFGSQPDGELAAARIMGKEAQFGWKVLQYLGILGARQFAERVARELVDFEVAEATEPFRRLKESEKLREPWRDGDAGGPTG